MKWIKCGEEVVVITGAHKGKRGKLLSIDKKKHRVKVEGVAMVKRHMRKSQEHQAGAIVEREGTIHYSNIMVASAFDTRQKGAK